MKLSPSEVGEDFLAQLGREVVTLLRNGEFRLLADRFGYALAFERDPAAAIEEELGSCVMEYHDRKVPRSSAHTDINVKYFNRNTANLYAVVECEFDGPDGCPIHAELIVITNGEDKHVALEQVSIAA